MVLETHFYTGSAFETVLLTIDEHKLEKNFNPVCPPGTLLKTKHIRAITWITAAIVVRIVDCKLRAKYNVANSDEKYTEVNTNRSDENRCFI